MNKLYSGMSSRSACLPSSSDRALAPLARSPASRMRVHTLPGNCGESMTQQTGSCTGLTGRQYAKKLHKLFKSSRKRLEQHPLAAVAVSSTPCDSVDALQAELHALNQRLGRLSALGTLDEYDGSSSDSDSDEECTSPTPRNSTSTVCKTPQPRAQSLAIRRPNGEVVDFLQPPELDLEQPEFAARNYGATGRVLVCQGSKCRAKGATGVLQAVSAVVGESQGVDVLPCKCLGKCSLGAVIRVKQEGDPRGQMYTQVQPQAIGAILDSHFVAGGLQQ
eukprot:CAMPEP_0202893030 /NCGR_PEP_ID=MMETSP1392-20130828/2683_1 /ASSEMBLY_ACC=CAM_ASM_000868 /TAXON_ID=225041 /ORGANISM="Chlamydomonas chlamydogama, Strain SAG 11-48b" /LENGTH=276 /DNA_ID=CAMNT_0049577211 /DNA_START=54 /DNA_END=884 /DNA_ORIENTATION=+